MYEVKYKQLWFSLGKKGDAALVCNGLKVEKMFDYEGS